MSHARRTAGRGQAIELERRIAAPPATVFTYFTDPDKYRRWQGVEAELDPQAGGVFRVTMTGHSRHTASGVFLEVDPPRRIVFTWGWEPSDSLGEGQNEVPPGMTTVEVELQADGGDTVLRLRHGGLPSASACRFHAWGWDLTLDRLVAAAVGADLLPNPFESL